MVAIRTGRCSAQRSDLFSVFDKAVGACYTVAKEAARAIHKPVPATLTDDLMVPILPDTSLNARDRLLDILKKIPRISQEDAAAIDRVVQEAREASIADELSA